MRRRLVGAACSLGLLAMVGCAGKGELLPIQIQIQPVLSASAKPSQPGERLRVTVTPFEDLRQDKNRLGTRTHLWGGESYFNVPGGLPGEATAQALADYLAAKGWQVVKPGATDDHADVILSGKIQEFAVDAKSGVGSTKLTTKTKVAVQARNTADGSLVRMTLGGAGSDRVFWFNPEDAQTLLNEVFTESVEKLIQDTKVEHRMLRLK